MPSGSSHLRFHARAQARYLRLLFHEFRVSLLIFLSLLLVGGLLVYSSDLNLSLPESIYRTFTMALGQPLEFFPRSWFLQWTIFFIPIVGLTTLAEGILRFGLLIFAKQYHQKEWTMALASTYRKHTILVGLGNVGYRIYESLRQLSTDVVVIELNKDCPFTDVLLHEGIPVMTGDARKEEYLKQLSVEHAANLIAATDNDLANLEVALDARRLNPALRIFVRMFDQNFGKKIQEQFNFQLVFSTSATAAPMVAGMVLDPTVKNAFYLDDRLMVVAELKVHSDSMLIGKNVQEMPPCNMVALCRDGSRMLFPRWDTRLQDGDTVLLQTTVENLEELHRLNQESALLP